MWLAIYPIWLLQQKSGIRIATCWYYSNRFILSPIVVATKKTCCQLWSRMHELNHQAGLALDSDVPPILAKKKLNRNAKESYMVQLAASHNGCWFTLSTFRLPFWTQRDVAVNGGQKVRAKAQLPSSKNLLFLHHNLRKSEKFVCSSRI